jgi:outer membrane protein OmpA-like peptidoglycan-associated protein
LRALLAALLVGCGAATPVVPSVDAALDLDRDHDGLTDAHDVCPCEAEDIDGWDDDDGCPDPDNDRDGIADACDQCPNEPETFNGICDEDGCPDHCVPDRTTTRIVILQQIAFARGRAVIAAESAPLVELVADAMRQLPELTLVAVIGSVDVHERPGLALARAQAVIDALVAHGVDAARFVAETEGASERRVRFDVRTRRGEPDVAEEEAPVAAPTDPASCRVPACSAKPTSTAC